MRASRKPNPTTPPPYIGALVLHHFMVFSATWVVNVELAPFFRLPFPKTVSELS